MWCDCGVRDDPWWYTRETAPHSSSAYRGCRREATSELEAAEPPSRARVDRTPLEDPAAEHLAERDTELERALLGVGIDRVGCRHLANEVCEALMRLCGRL